MVKYKLATRGGSCASHHGTHHVGQRVRMKRSWVGIDSECCSINSTHHGGILSDVARDSKK
jgi:hypothetical protein